MTCLSRSPKLKINRKHHKFARMVVSDTDKTIAEIHAACYGVRENGLKESSRRCMGHTLKGHPAIAALIKEYQAMAAEACNVTVQALLDELEEARIVGKQNKAAGPMVAATMGKAKLCGLDKQIIEHVGDVPVGRVTIEVVSARPEHNGN
jgi:hypothetical protein